MSENKVESVHIRMTRTYVEDCGDAALAFNRGRSEFVRSILPASPWLRLIVDDGAQPVPEGSDDPAGDPAATLGELLKQGAISQMVASSRPIFSDDYQGLSPDDVAAEKLKFNEAIRDSLGLLNPDGSKPKYQALIYPAGGLWTQRGCAGYWRVLPKFAGFKLTKDAIVQVADDGTEHVVDSLAV